MKIRDERTEDQKTTHRQMVVGHDQFMSGWGQAENGASYAAWSHLPEQADDCYRYVRGRRDMRNVKRRSVTWRPSGENDHLAIYVFKPEFHR